MTTPWDPIVLSRIRDLHLRARILTDSLLMGGHRSRRVGQAVEFADYQEYTPGMSLRGLDWRVWARTDRYVVRRYETETELPCTVVLDLSGDLSTGEGGHGTLPDLDGTKAGYGITLAATLLYWLQRQGERVGLTIVGGEGAERRVFPPRGSKNHLQSLFAALASTKPGGRAGLGEALLDVGGRVRRRSLVAVISDGMEEVETWVPKLSALAQRGVDLRFFHLYDRGELNLSMTESSLVFSPEGGEAIAIDPEGVRNEFLEVVEQYFAQVRGGVLRFGGQYLPVPTDTSIERIVGVLTTGMTPPVEAP